MTDQVETTAVAAPPDAGGLSPEEQRFFETGDTSVLSHDYAPPDVIPDPPPAPAIDTAPAAPAPASPDAAPAVEPPQPPQPDYQRLMAEQQAAFQRQLAEMQRQFQQALQPPAPPPPDEFTDPLGAQLYKLNNLSREMDSLKATITQQQQQADAQRQLQQFVEGVKSDKAAFTATTPDFPKAYEHIRAVRTEDLRAAGCPEDQIAQVMLNDELQLAAVARQRGLNPAQQIYETAKRYGYQPQAAQAPAAAPAQAAAKPQDPNAHVQRLANGQFAARQPGKAPPVTEMTLESLKDASPNDIDKVVGDDRMWAQVVGGIPGGDIFYN